jgi:hypothetical protein
VDYGGKHGPNPVILGDNRPLRGWKTDLYEEGVRVPHLFTGSTVSSPSVLQAPVSTSTGALRGTSGEVLAFSDQWKLEGRNVWSLVSGSGRRTRQRRTLYVEYG